MRAACFAAALLLVMLGLSIPVFCEENYEQSVLDSLSEAAEQIEGAEDYELFYGTLEESGEGLIEFLSAEQILERVVGVGKSALGEATSLLVVLLGLVLLCAVCKSIVEAMCSPALVHGAQFVSSAAICSAIVSSQLTSSEMVSDFFERLGNLMGSLIPIGGTVLAMGGNVMTASVATATLYAMLSLTVGICSSSVMPVCFVSGTAAVCSALAGGSMLEGFCAAVKKVYNFVLGLVMSVFVFVLGAQTTIAAAADTAAARSGKFISSVLIPVVGGAIGDTVRTLAGSVSYIKSVVGVGGIVLVAVLTLPVLAKLLLCRLAFLVAGTVSQMLGCERESRLLGELGNIYGFLVGAVSICSVAFAVAIAMFVRCTVAIE